MSHLLFQEIAEVNARCDGWCELEKANTLAAMVLALRPDTVVEIGVYGGRSLIPMALALKHVGKGVAIGIDPWTSTASVQEMTEDANIKFWSQLDHERIYQRYLAQVAAAGVEAQIKTIRSRSDDVEPPHEIDICHIDGNHEEPAYRDMTRFGPKVRLGGILVADDLGWSSGAPKRGAEWLEANGFLRLYSLGTGAVFQRVK